MVETFFVRFSNIPQSRSLSCCTIFPFFQIKKFLWSKIFLLLKGWSKLIISPIFFKLNFPSESDTKCNQNRIKWYQNPSRSNNIKINPPDSTFQLVISWITPSHLFYYTVSGYTETGGYHTSIWKINSTHRPDHNNWYAFLNMFGKLLLSIRFLYSPFLLWLDVGGVDCVIRFLDSEIIRKLFSHLYWIVMGHFVDWNYFEVLSRGL